MKVAVVGAGITGITTAYFLAKAGHEVVIYDKRKYPAMATSYANGGQLSASMQKHGTVGEVYAKE